MSETGSGREWRFYLDDMIGFAEAVLAYTDGLDQTGFVASRLNYDATLRNLELIGEAAGNIPETCGPSLPRYPGARWWRHAIASSTAISVSTTTRSGASSATTCRYCWKTCSV